MTTDGKRDRLARFYRVLRYLAAHEEGATVDAVAAFVGMSRRTVYRDLQALEGEIGIPLWSEGGRWGIVEGAFLPPLRLTLDEALAFFLAARLMAQFADRHEPDIGAAFQKLAEILPPVVARHLERTIDVMASRPPDERLTRHLRARARAGAEPRGVVLT
jgi:proteasome accessory factor B